jgi:hypothetical protein
MTFYPRGATEDISRLSLPPDARLIWSKADRPDRAYSWKVSEEYLKGLAIPTDARPYRDEPASWQNFRLGKFGELLAQDLPADTEVLFYQTSFYAVAVCRSLKERKLFVSGIYNN